ncbi:DUF2933 domain-containing protein [Hahella ganghwensis]|uniref:DUF2933 domain-containing protein n=1 Tax=Hahella ganghwensis TaxID=286420 RepID=UPI0003735CD1
MNKSPKAFWLSPKGLSAIALIAVASYFLMIEHRQHLFQALPYLLILLCPLMHIFMHRGHGSHQHSKDENMVKMDDYRRGYEDAKKDIQKHNEEDQRHER